MRYFCGSENSYNYKKHLKQYADKVHKFSKFMNFDNC